MSVAGVAEPPHPARSSLVSIVKTLVRVPILCEPGVEAPAYATAGAAGVDLRSRVALELLPLQRAMVPTGVRVAIPVGFEAQIRPRSGLAIRHGISMVNTPGTIDSDYRGEIQVLLINLSPDLFTVEPGDRIAQMVICPVAHALFDPVENLDDTERGEGGFGSTGSK